MLKLPAGHSLGVIVVALLVPPSGSVPIFEEVGDHDATLHGTALLGGFDGSERAEIHEQALTEEAYKATALAAGVVEDIQESEKLRPSIERFETDETLLQVETNVPTMADLTLAPIVPPPDINITNATGFAATGPPLPDTDPSVIPGNSQFYKWATKTMECDMDGQMGSPIWVRSADACVGLCEAELNCTHVNVERWPAPPTGGLPIRCFLFAGAKDILDQSWRWIPRPIPDPVYEKADEISCYVKSDTFQAKMLATANSGITAPADEPAAAGLHPAQVGAIVCVFVVAAVAVAVVIHRKRSMRDRD